MTSSGDFSDEFSRTGQGSQILAHLAVETAVKLRSPFARFVCSISEQGFQEQGEIHSDRRVNPPRINRLPDFGEGA